MMYVVKVGEYYVRKFSVESLDICIVLSKELMRTFDKAKAQSLAKQLNGEVVEIADQVTMDEEKYKELSLFDKEVQNNE